LRHFGHAHRGSESATRGRATFALPLAIGAAVAVADRPSMLPSRHADCCYRFGLRVGQLLCGRIALRTASRIWYACSRTPVDGEAIMVLNGHSTGRPWFRSAIKIDTNVCLGDSAGRGKFPNQN
jgi:hypothetical protein